MQPQLEKDLEQLKETLLTMASHAEAVVQNALRALTERDDALARRVKEQDDVIDQLEKDVDEAAVHLLSKAPLASDLRLILMAMKISRDLERVGDEATTIARRALELNQEPPIKDHLDLPRMAELALGMLKDSLDAFVHRDAEKARAVVPRDKEIDALNKQTHRVLANQIVEDPSRITRGLNLMVISKSLERIGDHAANIAEEVVFLYEGEDIRHTQSKNETSARPAEA
jgi:phosphate transport system protein